MNGKGSLRYESIAAEPTFQSALQAATGNETEIAKLHTKHLSDFGGYYLADVSFQIHTHIHSYVFLKFLGFFGGYPAPYVLLRPNRSLPFIFYNLKAK